jgi:predicted kinase
MSDRQGQRDPASDQPRVPVLVITGPVGVGKTTTAAAVSDLLAEQSIRHARVDLAQITKSLPSREEDPWNERLAHRNLACMWANFREVGAERLIASRVLESRSLLRRLADAVPGAEVVVVRLRAPLAVVHARIRARNSFHPEWFLEAATYLSHAMEELSVEDHLVDNAAISIDETAQEVLRVTGWAKADWTTATWSRTRLM